MREEVKKFLFVGLTEDRASFFQRAQAKGIIHFIDPAQKGRKEWPLEVQKILQAIKILRGLPASDQEEECPEAESCAIVDKILSLSEENEKWLEEMRTADIEIARMEPFGEFSFEDIAYIEKLGHCKVQFFCARPSLFESEEEPDNLLFVSSLHGLDYFLSVSKTPFAYEKMVEMKFERSLSAWEREKQQAALQHKRVESELKALAKYNECLHQLLIEKLNQYHLCDAESYVQGAMDGKLFAVEGWVALPSVPLLDEMIAEMAVYKEEIAIEEGDVIPTCLENEGLARLGEDLVHIYDTPSSTDKDPSLWVLGGFALFFAFIIGDAGYGLVYLAIALFLRFKYPDLKGVGKRVLDLFTVLCVGCVIWGTLMTSFFGMQIALDNPLRKLSLVQWLAEQKAAYHLSHHDAVAQEWIEKFPELKQIKDPHTFVSFSPNRETGPLILNRLTDNIMFELALFVGVVHLAVSLLRYSLRNWQQIGWVLFLLGAYLYFPSYLQTPSLLNYVGGIDLQRGGAVGFQLMFIGIGLAWFLAIIRHGWTGIFEVMVLIQVFADTLSYLRLYALGLAGAIVGSTINEIASTMPLLIGVLLILVSHFINIVLSTMSGIIHGLRLNFLEWYHYSFEGGGRQFNPLKLLKRE